MCTYHGFSANIPSSYSRGQLKSEVDADVSGLGLNETIMTYDHHQPKLTPASCETRRILEDLRLLANICFHSIVSQEANL